MESTAFGLSPKAGTLVMRNVEKSNRVVKFSLGKMRVVCGYGGSGEMSKMTVEVCEILPNR